MIGKSYLDYNKSVLFVLPMLQLKAAGLGVGGSLFKNTYIGINTEPELDSHIFLHYKYSPKKDFIALESALMGRRNFVKDIHAGDDILYCFSVPELYKDDFNLFKQGKYSFFGRSGSDYKRQILRCYELGYEDPLTGLYLVNVTNHPVKNVNLLFPVINRLPDLKKVIEYNLSHYTNDLYFKSGSGMKLGKVDLGEQELFSIPDEREIYVYDKVRYQKNCIRLNKDFENE